MVRLDRLVVLPALLILSITTIALGACGAPGRSETVPGPAVIFVYTDN